MDEDVAARLAQLPEGLDAQRRLLGRLLAWCEQDDDVRWLTIGCSLARGNADWLSDLDVALGVREEHLEDAVGRVRQAVAGLGELVESYDYLMPLGFPLRRFFAQYRDRTQIDLTVGSAPTVAIPLSVVLYDPEGVVRVVGEEVWNPKQDEVRTWACKAWEALANVGKYLRRSSLWEALRELDEARGELFCLWALAEKVPQARYGLTALVDSGGALPPGIEQSLADPDLKEVLAAARYVAETLAGLQRRLSSTEPYELPHAFADFVLSDLANAL